jgi:exopolysaccharide biosynthesis polyprenyl glycosylphosphotransferase
VISDEVNLTGVAVPMAPRGLRLTVTPSPAAERGREISSVLWRRGLLGADVVIGTLAVLLAVVERFGVTQPLGPSSMYVALIVGAPLAWPGMLAVNGTYEDHRLSHGTSEFGRIANSGLWMLALLVVVSYITHSDISREVAAVAVVAMVTLSLTAHLVGRLLLHRRIRVGGSIHRAFVVGSRDEVRGLVDHIGRLPHAGLRVVGVCLAESADSAGGEPSALHRSAISEILESARNAAADTVVVAGSGLLSGAELRRLSWDLEGTGIRILVSPGVTELAGPRLVIRPIGGLPLLNVQEAGFHGASWWLKSALDRLFAVVLCVILSPVFAAIAVAVRLSGPGPVLYRQSRVGLKGREFTLLKFRTMCEGADQDLAILRELNEHDGPLFKMRRDPRVTPVGRFLRRYSLDELPQIWNVLTGTMSLIGPRPPLASEVDRYPGDLRRRRLLVRPGITGLWQVSGRSDLSWDETVRLDLQYVENWSVLLDAAVMWKTVRAVVSGRGAY